MKPTVFDNLLRFLNELERARISYALAHYRDEALMVQVAVPGERWEIEFLDDGSVEVERFISSGEIRAEDALDKLFALYADYEPDTEAPPKEIEFPAITS